MALHERDGYRYGDAQEDIRAELALYTREGGYPAEHFHDAVCTCGGRTFRLFVDETEGVGVRICHGCEDQHVMGDGGDYAGDAQVEECVCVCEAGAFEITAGVALYPGTGADSATDSDRVRWLYIGCRCTSCGLVGCYGDWKNEAEGYRALLARM